MKNDIFGSRQNQSDLSLLLKWINDKLTQLSAAKAKGAKRKDYLKIYTEIEDKAESLLHHLENTEPGRQFKTTNLEDYNKLHNFVRELQNSKMRKQHAQLAKGGGIAGGGALVAGGIFNHLMGKSASSTEINYGIVENKSSGGVQNVLFWGAIVVVTGLLTYTGIQKYLQGRFKISLTTNGPLASWDKQYAYGGIMLCRDQPPKPLQGNTLYLYYQTTSSEQKDSKKIAARSKKIKKPLIPSGQISHDLIEILKEYKFSPTDTLTADVYIHAASRKSQKRLVNSERMERGGSIEN